MYLINNFVCAKGHKVRNVQYNEPRACLVCFQEWQEATFPLTATPQEPSPPTPDGWIEAINEKVRGQGDK